MPDGWPNLETWVVYRELWDWRNYTYRSDEAWSYKHWQDQAREIFGFAINLDMATAPPPYRDSNPSEIARDGLAMEMMYGLRDAVERWLRPYMVRDFLMVALSRVDWPCIANGFLEGAEAKNNRGETVRYAKAP